MGQKDGSVWASLSSLLIFLFFPSLSPKDLGIAPGKRWWLGKEHSVMVSLASDPLWNWRAHFPGSVKLFREESIHLLVKGKWLFV